MNYDANKMTRKTQARPTDDRGFAALWAGIGAIALLALGLSAAGLFLPNRNGGGGGSTGATVEKAGAKTVYVSLGEMYARPSRIEVPSGTDLTLVVRNVGTTDHNLRIDGKTGTAMLKKGRVETLKLGPVTTPLSLWCTVEGHKDGGMHMEIAVTGGAAAAQAVATPAVATASSGNSAAGSDQATEAEPVAAVIDPAAEPATNWKPYDPTLRPAPGGVEHKITMRATEKVIEVAPGVRQEMWTFDDIVPGPVLRGKVGDIFTVTLVNGGKIAHSVDFHASKVAWNDEMRSIGPGESLVYQFEAKHAGAYMYHCGTSPALHHIGNGMFGAILIDPPVLAPVDHEFMIVQSELYLGPQAKPGSLKKMMASEWDAVVFNGYLNQYLHRPIQVEPQERIRVWVVDAGPSENSAFHVVGTVFDTVFREGTYTLRPDDGRGGSQVLSLQPAEGGFVEFSFDEPGLYPIVTHKFANVGKGALGLFRAGPAEPPKAGEPAH